MAEQPASQVSAWLEYFDQAGYPADNLVFMLGQVAAAAYNVEMPRGRKPLEPQLFYPAHLRPAPKRQSWQQQLGIFKQMARTHGSSK